MIKKELEKSYLEFGIITKEDLEKRDVLAKMYDEYFDNTDCSFELDTGDLVKGVINTINDTHVSVNINAREDVWIPIGDSPELSDTHLGQEIDVKITQFTAKPKRNEYSIMGSVKEFERDNTFIQLRDAVNKPISFTGTVTSTIKGIGYVVSINGFSCFLPGSQAAMNLLSNPESLIGKELQFFVVNANDSIVLSHKAYLRTKVNDEVKAIIINKHEYTGTVTGVVDFGVFVEFNGCLTGMIYVDALDTETRKEYDMGVLKSGDPITFRVKEVISERKIKLYQGDYQDPWDTVKTVYPVGKVVKGKIVKANTIGLTIRLANKLHGLLLLEEFSEDYTVGRYISVEVLAIIPHEHKIYLGFPHE